MSLFHIFGTDLAGIGGSCFIVLNQADLRLHATSTVCLYDRAPFLAGSASKMYSKQKNRPQKAVFLCDLLLCRNALQD